MPLLLPLLAMALLVVVLSMLAIATVRADTPVVTDIRVARHDGGATRVVLDVSTAVDFSVFSLADPYRVVVDLPEVGWRLPARPLPGATGLFARVRYGLFKPGTSRVVLDLSGPGAVAGSFIMRPSLTAGPGARHRLVVDLVPTGHAAFMKGVGTRHRATVVQAPAEPEEDDDDNTVALPAVAAPAAPAATPTPTRVAVRRFPFQVAPRKPRLGPVRYVVALDPGHGGADPGAIGVSGIYEKHLTLAVAREVKQKLEAGGGFKVVLTRDRDKFIRLRDRIARARAAGADLFVSIHADSIPNRRIRGLSVYTLSEKASDREAAALADKENKADLIGGIDLTNESPEVTNILIDLAQRETMNESVRFAATLVAALRKETRLLRNSHRFAGFVVLKSPDVPSVLIELGFLSNRTDERNLRRKEYRGQLASAIDRAVRAHFARVEEASR
ncbi:MAG: N-acetylmuramoyl-L-alanine amidase [Rhodobacterales bacterium]|nr:N-acetylmuramoyl-L-alanine amidase [Rhodobacterales bacterium]